MGTLEHPIAPDSVREEAVFLAHAGLTPWVTEDRVGVAALGLKADTGQEVSI